MACYALYIHTHHEFKQNDQERGIIQLPEHDTDMEEELYTDTEDEDDAATIVVLPSTPVNEKQPILHDGEYPLL